MDEKSDNLEESEGNQDSVNKLTSEEKDTENTSQPESNAKKSNQDNESENNRTSSGEEERPDEDVPEDFFDDFLKEDFMAGLDIVDEDNEDSVETIKEEPKSEGPRKLAKKKVGKGSKKLYKSKIDHVKKFRDSPPGENTNLPSKHTKKSKKLKARDEELKKLDQELEEIKLGIPKKVEKTGLDADNFDIRRDPEKTRQAIQRDKIKSAKDKEKRLITDIVQTGLVPPGMELEVDIEEVCRNDKTNKKENISDLREKIRPRISRSKSNNSRKSKSSVKKRPLNRSPMLTKKRKSRTPPRTTTLSSVKLPQEPKGKNRSPARKSPLLRRSPLYRRSPQFRRSPIRRSPLLTRSSDLSQEQGSQRYARSPRKSPIMRRTRSPRRSPSFRRRSRSRSLTNRSTMYRRSRSKDRSMSYRRRRDRSFSPLDQGRRRRTRSRSPRKTKKEEKVSFLEELVAKLNETHPSQLNTFVPSANYFVPNQLLPPLVAPVPPVNQQPPVQVSFFPPTPVPQQQQHPPPPPPSQPYDPYDESFFIGTTAPSPMPQSKHKPNIQQFEKQKPLINPNSLRSTPANGVPRYEADLSSDRDVAKLFGDKRIKLSDFLAITAKPQVSNASTTKLQEKIKVIQRCQDAIKILNERKFTGPLVVHKTDSYEYSKDMTVSPLLRKPIVQLPFTTPGLKKNPAEMDFTKCCETLLYRVGIEKRLVLLKKQEKPSIVPPKEVAHKDTPPPILPSKQYSEASAPIKVITKSLSTQTDKELSSCKECLRRKGTLYANCGVQAGNPMVTFSVSTQVNEADFYSMIPRNQSLASLTPAQLLGKQSMIADLTKLSSGGYDHLRSIRNFGTQDNMSRGRQIPSPPPPPMFNFPVQSLSLQNDSPYPPPLFSQSALLTMNQKRNSIPPHQTFNDDRRGGFQKRF